MHTSYCKTELVGVSREPLPQENSPEINVSGTDKKHLKISTHNSKSNKKLEQIKSDRPVAIWVDKS